MFICLVEYIVKKLRDISPKKKRIFRNHLLTQTCMTEHQREAECVSYCLTMKMDKDQGKKSTVKHCKFRPFSKPVWPNRSDSKE